MLAAGIVVAVLALVVGARSVIVVPDDSAYVVERLGGYQRTLTSGLHVLTPFIDRVAFRYSLLSKDEQLSDTCITLDNVAITIASTFRWQVAEPRQAAYAAASETDFVRGVVRSAQRQWIGERPWNNLRETTRELQQGVLRLAAEPAASAGVKVTHHGVVRIERAAG